MKTSDFLVEFLINKGVTDVFGIPGGVILDFLDSINKKGNTINARLNFNEQASSFAANGYAQASGKLAVAYATRGPGITNMITGILDSFGDSFPVLFITAHSKISKLPGTRVEETQEFDTTKLVSSITKYAVKIECLDSVQYELEKSFYLATSGRPGPVVIDFLSSVLAMDINIETQSTYLREKIFLNEKSESIINSIENELKKAKRPVLLIGNGIRQSNMETYIKKIAKNWAVPILSSRSAQDIIPGNENYFGYIGSHAIRYSNFILSKCDLIVALGNSLMFNPESESFGTITKNAKILRINVDASEFLRELPNSICYDIDLKDIMHTFEQHNFQCDKNWLDICKQIKMKLYNYDTEYPVNMLALLINAADMNTIIISDVGNNEFWLSRAYIFSGATNRILYSISFSSLGCSLPKAIGAYYSSGKKILCFTGDQGLQMNLQELQYISHHKLPIKIMVINNFSSGLIREQQKNKYDSRFESTTCNSGYSIPDLKKISNAFDINYYNVSIESDSSKLNRIFKEVEPALIEIVIDEDVYGIPYLPKGRPFQDLEPKIDRELYNMLERM